MKKIFFILTVFVFNAYFAYGDSLITENISNGCTFAFNQALIAYFAPDEYTCATGYYLPADATSCASCLTGYTCVGGTYAFNENTDQGIVVSVPITTNVDNGCGKADLISRTFLAVFEPDQYICSAGYYLPADETECTLCPADNICVGGTYTFNETTDQGIVACAAPTPYAPTGSSQCYPHILHVDDGVVYLRSTKLTSPSLHIRIEDDVFYANMTTIPTRMNKDSQRYFHSQWDDNHYYICDDTTYPGE